jgi:hypothetical protein
MKAIWKAGSGKKRKEGALQERGNTTLGDYWKKEIRTGEKLKLKHKTEKSGENPNSALRHRKK